MPGNNPHQYYICTTRLQKNYWTQKNKINWSLIAIIIISCVAHIGIAIRYHWYKKQEKKKQLAGKWPF